MSELKNGISFYGGSATEADWYEKPGRVVQIIIGGKIVFDASRLTPVAPDRAEARDGETDTRPAG